MKTLKYTQLYFLIFFVVNFKPLFSADSEKTLTITAVAVEAQGRRNAMEDTHVHGTQGDIFHSAVYDGHGGKIVAEHLSGKDNPLHELILNKINDGTSIEQSFRDSYQEADKKFNEYRSCGSTAVNLIIKDNTAHVANVGDAEAIVFTKEMDEEPIVLSEIHKPTTESEKKRINEQAGDDVICFGRVGGVLAISRAFGDFDFKKPIDVEGVVICDPSIQSLKLKENHAFALVMCDGLREGLKHIDIANFVRQKEQEGLQLQAIADELLQYGLGHSNDNITFILIKLDWTNKVQ